MTPPDTAEREAYVRGYRKATGQDHSIDELPRIPPALRDHNIIRFTSPSWEAWGLADGREGRPFGMGFRVEIAVRAEDARSKPLGGTVTGAGLITDVGPIGEFGPGAAMPFEPLPEAPKVEGQRPLFPDVDTPPGRGEPALPEGDNCFPAGTLLGAEFGLMAVERLGAGDRVWSYDFAAGRWVLREVKTRFERVYDGDLIDVQVRGERIRATANHPFWVAAGEALATRPAPGHVEPREPACPDGGRWVNARDLRVGDVLLLRDSGAPRWRGWRRGASGWWYTTSTWPRCRLTPSARRRCWSTTGRRTRASRLRRSRSSRKCRRNSTRRPRSGKSRGFRPHQKGQNRNSASRARAEWRYRRYVYEQFQKGKGPDDIISFSEWKSRHFDTAESGGRPGRSGGPEQVAARKALEAEGFRNVENVELGEHFPDMTKPNAQGGTDYVEVGKMLEDGRPKARERDKLADEVSHPEAERQTDFCG